MPIWETNEESDRFLGRCVTEAKGDRIALHELREEYVLGTGKNINADRQLGTSAPGLKKHI